MILKTTGIEQKKGLRNMYDLLITLIELRDEAKTQFMPVW